MTIKKSYDSKFGFNVSTRKVASNYPIMTRLMFLLFWCTKI